MAEQRTTAKALPTLVEELWSMVVAYFKQETVEPLKGLGRYVGVGLAGSVLVGGGLLLLSLALLRALQEETGPHLTGHLTFVPYAVTAVVTIVVMIITASRIGKRPNRK